jgi:hypothetical protein
MVVLLVQEMKEKEEMAEKKRIEDEVSCFFSSFFSSDFS